MPVWREEFGPVYHVPKAVESLVARGLLEDTSWHTDSSPSFSARLVKRGWLRLWVEHPDPRFRQGPHRYAVEVTPDLSESGRILIESDSLDFIMPTLMANLEKLGVKSRFRLLGGGV